MIADARDLAKLEADFRSGRNTRAYLPLCTAYRRERRFSEAVELCQQGLSADPRSIAGRSMLARLLADLGRYEEALAEVARGERIDSNALGLLVEKARCQLRLHMQVEAEQTIATLLDHYPMDSQVKILEADLRAMTSSQVRGTKALPAPEVMANAQPAVALEALVKQARAVGTLLAAAVVDLDTDKTVVEAPPNVVPLLEDYYGEVAEACLELEQGEPRLCILELENALLFIYRRDRRLAILLLDPAVNFGKFMHRMQPALDAYLPVAARGPVTEEDEV